MAILQSVPRAESLHYCPCTLMTMGSMSASVPCFAYLLPCAIWCRCHAARGKCSGTHGAPVSGASYRSRGARREAVKVPEALSTSEKTS